MSHRRFVMVFLGAFIICFAGAALAQWPSDPAVNLPIAVLASEQAVPKIAATSDGGCYVGWYDLSYGSYAICLQRLDPAGRELWPHNGIPVSLHPQLSYVTDWDLIADSEDNAVLVFSDARYGEDLDIQAYRVGGDGQMLWGADGITLSTANSDFEPAPVVTEASDGDFVFAWARFPDVGGGAMQMQRVSRDGVPRFPVGGLPVVGGTNEDPAFPRMVPVENGAVIMIWVRDISMYSSPRHLRAQKFSVAGAPVWPAVVPVYDAASVPMGYGPSMYPDEAGGVLVLWHAAPTTMFNSMVQHLTGNGVELFLHNGATVSTVPTRHHIDPALAYHPDTGEIFVIFNERNDAQTQWGIYGQKFTASGERAWGSSGIIFVPVNTTFKHTQRAAPCGDGASAFFIEEEALSGNARIVGFRVDALGGFVWPGSFITVSSAPSTKSRLPIVHDSAGEVILVWEDGRNDFADVYGQNVNPDGSLGVDPTAVPVVSDALTLAANHPNPFSTSTRFALDANALGGARDGMLLVSDASGRLVRMLPLGAAQQGRLEVAWDGCDDGGRPLPAGVYLYRLAGASGAAGRAIIVR